MNVPPYSVDAALKLYCDEWTGKQVGYLWRPGVRYTLTQGDRGWQATDDGSYDGDPPVEELANRTRLLRAPSSELAGVTPLLDVYTLLMADLIVAADTGAFPIRTATASSWPVTRRRVIPKTPFDVRVDRAMVSENPQGPVRSPAAV
jgi:hypothetical protein